MTVLCAKGLCYSIELCQGLPKSTAVNVRVPRACSASQKRSMSGSEASCMTMKMLEPGYVIRSARLEELVQLAAIEQSAARLFAGTPYAFLVQATPLSYEVVLERFRAGQVWVAIASPSAVVGYVVTKPVEHTLYLQQIDVDLTHGRRGIGTALISTVSVWAYQQGYSALSLSTFRTIPWNAPFYARLGFQPLDEAELLSGFRDIRQQEAEAGLPIADRVIMQCRKLPISIENRAG
ncbi:GNAT family N-acetyltransferase [filamentous cyanobacterium CCT1]|nr:GNAT family N-acetyltransferase [filamentous cyanobacterium CCT1]PSN77566.1 GNAT family N-acetyltransferase [filamentous cyanobacterium CCP4]